MDKRRDLDMTESNNNDNNSSISIRDNNSQILSILPKEWIEPLTIICRVKGYDGIDSYVKEMIRDRLAMFADSRDDLGEYFQDYMKDIEGLEDTDSREKYVEVKLDSDLVERLNKVEERKKEKEEDPNSDEGARQFVKDVNDSYHDMKQKDDKEKESLK
jgi:hypothetical protein